jgi:hypothetical protein
LPRGIHEPATGRQHRLAGQAGRFGAAIDPITKPHQTPIAGQTAQHAQDLIFAAKIAEFARQEDIVSLFGDPSFHPFPQCLPPPHGRPFCKNPALSVYKNPTKSTKNDKIQ